MISGKRIADFIAQCSLGAYVEPESELHTSISRQVWEQKVKPVVNLPKKAGVLDLGCGSGHAMWMFFEEGFDVFGYSCLQEEVDKLNAEAEKRIGFICAAVKDMHADVRGFYDLIWARHVLEHSPIPSFVLSDLRESLKRDGYLYVEVPLPDTACHHEINSNHWTVLTQSGWRQLILRAGFTILEEISVKFASAAGDDEYVGFICKKATA